MGWEDKKKSFLRASFSLDDHVEPASQGLQGEADILGETRFIPMDVFEEEDRLIVEIDLPGMAASDIDVTIQNNMLVVEGLKRESIDAKEKINFLCMERSFGPFKRLLTVPAVVDQDGVSGEYKKGVLIITLPKLVERRKKTRRIPIESEEG